MNFSQQMVALKTIFIKEYLRFIRIWIQTILPPAITIALYFIIFGQVIGSQISDINGYKYMDYIVPGLILMAVITNSYANVVSSFFSAKFHHSVEEMLVSPLPNNIILLGFVAGGVARGLIVGFVATVVSMYFSELQVHSYLVTFSVVILTSILFSLAGFINAAYARSFDDITIIPTFVLTPLIYLGGVFYSIKMLPEIWQQVSLANPILYMVNAFHYGILGVSDIEVSNAFVIIIAFIVVLYYFALRLLRLGVGLKP